MHIETASTTPEGLIEAFAATEYCVNLGGRSLVVRVGRHHPALDRSLDARGWTILTACNPQGQRRDEAFNRRARRRLAARIDALGRARWPAINRDPSGAWPDEAGLLVADLDAVQRAALAREFDQAASVTGRPGQATVLELYGPGWPTDLPDWAVRGR